MKAIVVNETGGPDKLVSTEKEKPAPGAGDVLVKMAASGVNYIDTYHRTGLYKLPLPFTPGLEGAGTIESVGADVKNLKPGDRVSFASGKGCYAEYATVPGMFAATIPDGLDLQQAAASMLQGMTAHYLTHSTYKLRAGDTALVHAAAGGVGLLLVQIAKMLGATVIGTTSTKEKADKAREAGADHMILYTEQDFAVETRRLTGGKGVQVAYDSVGKSTWEGSLNSLAPLGMMVTFGNASGPVPAFEPLILNQKGSLFVTRPKLADYIATPDAFQWRAGDILGWARSGKLKLHIERTYPLAEARQSHIDIESRKTTGKLLLIP